MSSASKKPKIWVAGFSLTGFLPEILPDYAAVAELRVVNKIFEEGVGAARDLLASGDADVFIATGANGAYLKEHLDAPVVQIKVSGFDILHALRRARQVSERIAIFSYQAISAELEEIKEILKLDIEQCFYTTAEDARERVQQLARDGFRVIVGSSMINRIAAEVGLAGVFLYSAEAVRRALDDAIDLARVARVEETRREWLNASLLRLAEGVVAVDGDERIQSANPAFARLLGVSVEWALGRRLSELAPELSLARTLRSGEAEPEQVVRVGGRILITNRLPILEGERAAGAVLTCQDANAIQRADRSLRVQNRPRQFVAKYQLARIVGASPQTVQAKAVAARYAAVDATLLISGESGTGKELYAQGIHNASRRSGAPFVAVNCAAFAESLLESELFGYEEGAFTGARKGGKAGLFEAAHTGTLFLDEIGEMPLALQAKLLRVLQEKEVLRLGSTDPTPIDVRILAATHRDLRRMVGEGQFREDLFYRLNILNLHLPPLRERPADIAALAGHFLDAALQRLGATRTGAELLPRLLPHLAAYPWPGNIRELENIVERVSVFLAPPDAALQESEALLRAIVPELFGAEPPPHAPLKASSRAGELAHIRRVLGECGGDQSKAAQKLGISRTTLWRKLRGKA
ncbi:MAG: propionate catabolism operon regulatory protein PrpR [Sulfuricella sp.]|nr:propionate catabolism operon regulatory protein PrpR [Sulfuricella sp.]